MAPADNVAAPPQIARLAEEVLSACLEYRAARATSVPSGLFKLDELPEPAPAWRTAYTNLRELGHRLYLLGGDDLMRRVFDEVVETHGYQGVNGCGPAWDGIGGWKA